MYTAALPNASKPGEQSGASGAKRCLGCQDPGDGAPQPLTPLTNTLRDLRDLRDLGELGERPFTTARPALLLSMEAVPFKRNCVHCDPQPSNYFPRSSQKEVRKKPLGAAAPQTTPRAGVLDRALAHGSLQQDQHCPHFPGGTEMSTLTQTMTRTEAQNGLRLSRQHFLLPQGQEQVERAGGERCGGRGSQPGSQEGPKPSKVRTRDSETAQWH